MPAVTCDPLAEVGGIVRAAFEERKHEVGVKAALHDTAHELGLTVRRVRGLIYGEARSILATEYLAVKCRAHERMQARLRRLDAEADLLRARLAEWEGGG